MSTVFRTFSVIERKIESEVISSFYFQPTDGAPLQRFKPGQYLTLKIPSKRGGILKTYSLSNHAHEASFYRITVKREAGSNGAPDGIGSCWLHDCLQVNDTIQIAPPRGHFFLDEESTRPVLLLSGGVGLTPLVSMLHQLSRSHRKAYFLHACENGKVHALRDEVLKLTNNRIKAFFVYRNPSHADKSENRFDAEGMINKAVLDQFIPAEDYDVYICGPTPFMAVMYQLSQELGVAKNQIAYEFFGKASSLEKQVKTLHEQEKPHATSKHTKAKKREAINATPAVAAIPNITNPDAWSEIKPSSAAPATDSQTLAGTVTFSQSNKVVQWDDSSTSLLELAENAGLSPEFSCRTGICGTCACKLLQGEVEYFDEPLKQPEQGEVLICCTKPKGAVVLEI